ncbi:hypothetical protein FACS189413_03150 [Bacteroidia bacterium]|nr:hypothetical protein FACS189413_03150 [Bacteroidia bacterium]
MKKLLIVSLHPRGGCFLYSTEIIARITDDKEVYLNEITDEKHNIKNFKTLKCYGFGWKRFFSLFFFLLKIYFYGKFTNRYKALLIMGFTAWDSFIAKVFKWTGKPVFSVIHDGKVHKGETCDFTQKRLLSTMNDSDYLIFLSEYVRQLVKDNFFIDKISHIAPHGLISYGNIPTKPKWKREKPVLLFLGRLSEYKGINILIEVLKNVPDVFEKVIIAGKAVPEYQVPSFDNPKIEVINRWLTDNEMADFLNECDILLFPYIEATQSGIASLAINYLVPSIVSDVGGLKEQFLGNSVFFIKPSSTEDLYRAIVELCTNDELYSELSMKLLQSRNSYSWDSIAKSLQTFINKHSVR